MEPTGDPFNSLMKLENTDSSPYNPMINAGAIVVASCLASEISFDTMLDTIGLSAWIRTSTSTKGLSLGNVSYFPQPGNRLSAGEQGYIEKRIKMWKTACIFMSKCSLSVTAESLAGLGLILANDGIHPTRETAFKQPGG